MDNFVTILINEPFNQVKIGIENPGIKITLRDLYSKNRHRLPIQGEINVNYQVYKNGVVTNIDCQVSLGDRFTFRKKDNSGK